MVRVEIQDTLNILANFKEEQMPREEVLMMLKHWIRKTAGHKSVTEQVAQQLLADNLDALRKIWQEAFLTLELDNSKKAESAVPSYLKEYRYAASGIFNIYKEVLGKSITKKTIHDHMTTDITGYSKLKKMSREKEYDSVLESDVIEYFYRIAHVQLKPEDIRKYSYKTPLKKAV